MNLTFGDRNRTAGRFWCLLIRKLISSCLASSLCRSYEINEADEKIHTPSSTKSYPYECESCKLQPARCGLYTVAEKYLKS